MSLDRVRLDIFAGIVSEQVKIFADPNDRYPVLEAQRIVLGFDPAKWFRRSIGLSSVRIRDGVFRMNTRGAIEEDGTPTQLKLDRVQARVVFQPGGVRVERISCNALGVELFGHGFIVRDQPSTAKPDRKQKIPRPGTVVRTMKKNRSWLPRLTQQLNAVEFSEPPRADIEFLIHMTNTALNELSFNISGGKTRFRGVQFDHWNGVLSLKGPNLELTQLSTKAGDEEVRLSGTMNLDNQIVEAHLFTSLSPVYWAGIVPGEWSDLLSRFDTHVGGSVSLDMHGGPSPLDQIADRFSGTLKLEEARLMGVWCERLALRCDWERPRLRVKEIDGIIGRDRGRGPVSGHITFDTEEKLYETTLQTGFDPHEVIPILNSNVVEFLHHVQFRDKPPRASLVFSGEAGNQERFIMDAELEAEQGVYNGAYLESLHATIHTSNRVMTLHPFSMTRSEGRFDGTLQQDFAAKSFYFEVTNTMHLQSFAQILGPVSERVARNFRAEGDARITAQGRINYGQKLDTAFDFSVEATRFGVLRLLADTCSFRGTVIGRHTRIRDIEGILYGGRFSGQADIKPDGVETNMRYEVSTTWTNVDFAQVISQLRQEEDVSYSGRFSGAIDVSGVFGEGRGDTVSGEGWLRIEEGQLWQVPVMSGLSRYASRIYPALGFAGNQEFSATYTLGDRKFHTDDVALIGRWMSVKGHGDYYFNEDVDFFAEVRPLGESRLAEALRTLTFPITSLLKFRLSGTRTEPRWRPDSWPTELLHFFEPGDDE